MCYHSALNRHSLEASVLGQCMHRTLQGPLDTANLTCSQTLVPSLRPNRVSFTVARWQKYRQLPKCCAPQIFNFRGGIHSSVIWCCITSYLVPIVLRQCSGLKTCGIKYQTMQHHTPRERILHSHWCQDLQTDILTEQCTKNSSIWCLTRNIAS